ncbi:MAG: peptidylprolyl isomerase [Marmoricola sp.]
MTRNRTLLALALPLLAVGLAGCGSSGSGGTTTGASAADTASCSYQANGSASRKVDPPPAGESKATPTTITISTNDGDIPLRLEPAQAPCTVGSFVSLAQQGFYDNTPCHRMLTSGDYILQCGDPTGSGTGGPGYTIPDELVPNDPRLAPCDTASGTCTYRAGTIAMANTGMKDSGGSQFFLMYGDSPFPPSYTVFGHTDASGLKVLKAIGAKGTANGATDGPPKEPVTITAVK